jgi:hypothetical protein
LLDTGITEPRNRRKEQYQNVARRVTYHTHTHTMSVVVVVFFVADDAVDDDDEKEIHELKYNSNKTYKKCV